MVLEFVFKDSKTPVLGKGEKFLQSPETTFYNQIKLNTITIL